MATWSAWKSIGSKSYVFETTLEAILGKGITMRIPLEQELRFTHNLHLSSPEDYICVIEMDGQFIINDANESVSYTISKRLAGINTDNFVIGGYVTGKSVRTANLLLRWDIFVLSEEVTFSFVPMTDDVGSFFVGSKASTSKVKIYLFKP